MTFTIAIIKKNKLNTTADEMYSQLTHNFIENIIKEYIDIIHVSTTEEMMEHIISAINLDEQRGGTLTCYEDDKNILQICYLDCDEQEQDKDNINEIGTHLVGNNLYGTIVLVNSKIKNDLLCETDNVTLDCIVDIFCKKIKFTGLSVSTNDDLENIMFFNDPIKENFNNPYEYIKISIFEFDLILFYQKNPHNRIINKSATKLMGTYRIYGNVVIVAYNDNHFENINKIVLNKLLKVCGINMSIRNKFSEDRKDADTIEVDGNKIKLNGIDKTEYDKDTNLPIATNKYVRLNMTLNNCKNMCNGCKQIISEVPLLCTGCYRIKYHSIECQEKDWTNHAKDCNFKNELN